MTKEVDWDRAERLFFELAELDRSERIERLDAACQGDDRLRGRVEGLLRARDERGSLLDRPSGSSPDPGERAGDRFVTYPQPGPNPARPRSRLHRSWAHLRRHPTASIAVAFALLLAAAFSTSAALAFDRARREREQARAAELLLAREAERSRALSDFLGEMLETADPRAAAREVDENTLLNTLLDAADGRIEGQFGGEPLAEAQIRASLARALWASAREEAARRQWERVVDLRTAELGRDHVDTLDALLQLAVARRGTGDLEGALRDAAEVADRRISGHGPQDALARSAVDVAAGLCERLGRDAEARAWRRRIE